MLGAFLGRLSGGNLAAKKPRKKSDIVTNVYMWGWKLRSCANNATSAQQGEATDPESGLMHN